MTTLDQQLGVELDALRDARTYKRFLTLESAQGPVVQMEGRGEVIVLSSNNYLGLAGHPEVVRGGDRGARALRRRHGVGALHLRDLRASPRARARARRLVRHRGRAHLRLVLERERGGHPEPHGRDDRVLTDELNHASLIDAIRLSRPAGRSIYPHSDMAALRDGSRQPARRTQADRHGRRLLDGGRSGEAARDRRARARVRRRRRRRRLARRRRAGRDRARNSRALRPPRRGRRDHGDARQGARRRRGRLRRGSAEVCDILAQRSRPQLFSNALPPTVACSALRASSSCSSAARASRTAAGEHADFRELLSEAGYEPLDGEAAIIPIIVGETADAMALCGGSSTRASS